MSTFHFSPRQNRAAEIEWQQWGDEPFERARSEGKPVLLAISAVWCHWCHVMDETTYSDARVIELINRRFVPVRVDNDQRPDVNARYNMGGWPTTVVLSEEGEVLQGGTYVPPDQLATLLNTIDRIYADPSAKLELAGRIRQARERRAAGPAPPSESAPAAVDAAIVDRLFERISVEYDDEYGGFGDEPKFPQTNVLHFLLDLCARSPNERAQEMVATTLRAMASAGMYDHAWGGFFRYSTTRDWSVPHFEKMLEDLGGLVFACARAAAMFADERLRDVAVDCVRYMDGHLWQADKHGYGGSQDADEEFYALDAAQRAHNRAPYVDPIVYTAWNMETARGLILSSALLAPASPPAAAWRARGLAIVEGLWSSALIDGLFCRYSDGTPRVRGLLVDQAWSAMAAIASFEATGDARWLERCATLLDACDQLFDERIGGYVDRLRDAPAPGKLADPHVPHEENALMARALARYARLTSEQARATRATAILARLSTAARRLGRFAAGIGSAVLEVTKPPIEVAVVGPTADVRATALRDAAMARPRPPLLVDTLDPARDALRMAALGHEPAAQPVANLCTATACFARATSPEELDAALEAVPVT